MQTAKALGKGCLFHFAGQDYTIAPWVQDVQAEYEKYFVARAYANLRAQRAELADEYEAERAALRRDVDAGDYEFGKPLVMRGLQSEANQKHLLYLSLAWAHKDDRAVRVDRGLVDRMAADPDKWAEALDLMAEANRDPNPPTPAPETAAGG